MLNERVDASKFSPQEEKNLVAVETLGLVERAGRFVPDVVQVRELDVRAKLLIIAARSLSACSRRSVL